MEVTLATMRAFPRSAFLQGCACVVFSNIYGAFSSAELTVAGGAVDAIAATLLSAGDDLEPGTAIEWQNTKRMASRALINCCDGQPAVAARAHQLGAASASVSALTAHPDDADVHCMALATLVHDDTRGANLALLSEGAVEALAEAVRAQPFDATVQEYGLYALGVLIRAEGGDGHRRASDAGAAELALKALRDEGRMLSSILSSRFPAGSVTRGSIRVNALFVISVLGAAGAAVARAVTEAMIAHPEHDETQRDACVILASIAHLQEEREAAVAAGAPEAIVRALRRFPELGSTVPGARGAGWCALAEMSTTPRCLLPAVTAGGVEAACDGLRRHLSKGKTCTIGQISQSLSNLLIASDMMGDRAAACALKRRAVAAGCAELLVSAAGKHPKSAELAVVAAVALGLLSADEPTCAERVLEAGGVELACAALRRVARDNSGHVALCAMAINNISSSSLAGAARAREAGALEVLGEAIRSFPEDEGVQKDCTEAIRSIARHDSESMRWAAEKMGFTFAEEEDSATPTAASVVPATPLGSVGTAAAQPAATEAPAPDGAEAEAPPEATTSASARPAGGVEQPAPPPRRACDNCGAQVGGFDPLGQPLLKLSACGGCCRGVRYCSDVCNRKAWPYHKAACKKKQAEQAVAAKAASADHAGGGGAGGMSSSGSAAPMAAGPQGARAPQPPPPPAAALEDGGAGSRNGAADVV